MNNKIKFAVLVALISFVTKVQAQSTFYLDGFGRVYTASDKLGGDAVGDSTIVNKGTGGYQLFDLGMNLEKDKSFGANVILRAKNQFGGFYGQGVAMTFRQMYVTGVIAKGIKYKIGDVDVKLSPYTLQNSYSQMTKYESDLFSTRRGIVEYENFVSDKNTWRLQGVDLNTKILFERGLRSLGVQLFGVRTNPFNQIGATDRVLLGGALNIDQSKYFQLGLNAVDYTDIKIETALQNYSNLVYSVAPTVEYPLSENMNVGVKAEVGVSKFSYTDLTTNKDASYGGNFWEALATFEMKDWGVNLEAGMKNVSDGYRAAGAQSMRYQDNLGANTFSGISSLDTNVMGSVSRQQSLFDRYTQHNMYNRNLSGQLQAHNPMYGNVEYHGRATANRTGIVVGLKAGKESKGFDVDLQYQNLSEVKSLLSIDGEKRKFSVIRAGGAVYLHKLLGFKKNLVVSGSYNSESTTRGGVNKIDLATNLIDGALTAEVLPNFDLLAGYKSLTSSGNEYLYSYTDLTNLPALETEMLFNSTQNTISLGGRFRFAKESAVSVTYNMTSTTGGYKLPSETVYQADYKWNQLFIHYFMKF